MSNTIFIALGALFGVAVLAGLVLTALSFRRVVQTNMVHIVQTRKKTTSYGTNRDNGNVYYEWPNWLPFIGVEVIRLPVSNFDLNLNSYSAYDRDRVPFSVDITAFFRIKDTNLAAQRVSDIHELKDQLTQIVQGAVRKVLANDVIDSIMLERSKFGDEFTEEISRELEEWGVESVKNMELMDIRDAEGSNVIENIMAKKTSEIEKESRETVAENMKIAESAEINAKQQVDIAKENARQAVGERQADADRAVGVANEKSTQEVKEQEALTAEKDMAVKRVRDVRAQEIERDKEIVAAEEESRTMIIIADANLEKVKRDSEAIRLDGEARAEAKRVMEIAEITGDVELAKEIGGNDPYMKYLLGIEGVRATEKIGVEQAGALTKANLKVIANAGDVPGGMDSILDMFTSKGGTNLAAALEGLAQSDKGRGVLERLGIKYEDSDDAPVPDESKNGGVSH